MFSRRIHLLVGAIPAAWLANGCFLGGDYFTERSPSDTDATQDGTTATPDASSSPETSPHPGVPPGSSNTSTPDVRQSDETSGGTTAPAVTLEGGAPSDGSAATTASSDVSSDPCYGFGCEEECEPDERSGPGGRCYWFSTTRMTWTSARDTCTDRGQGWTPLTLHTPDQDTFVAQYILTDTWLGAQYSGGTWRWIDDDASFPNDNSGSGDDAYANWGTNEPSGANGENCARYHFYRSTWRWSAAKCNEMFAVACQGPTPN